MAEEFIDKLKKELTLKIEHTVGEMEIISNETVFDHAVKRDEGAGIYGRCKIQIEIPFEVSVSSSNNKPELPTIWTRSNGEEMPIADMHSKHIQNAMVKIWQRNDLTDDEIELFLEAFKKELESRE